jgi:hypothetical protein
MQVRVTVTVELTTEVTQFYVSDKALRTMVSRRDSTVMSLAKEAIAHGDIVSVEVEKINDQ